MEKRFCEGGGFGDTREQIKTSSDYQAVKLRANERWAGGLAMLYLASQNRRSCHVQLIIDVNRVDVVLREYLFVIDLTTF